MKTKDKDILKTPELRENPFSVPEGYFSSVRKEILVGKRTAGSKGWRKVGAYAAVAASFALIIATGIRMSRAEYTQEEMDSIDLMVFSDMSTESYYDLIAVYEEEGLTEEDIIEYLIHDEISLDNIESYE